MTVYIENEFYREGYDHAMSGGDDNNPYSGMSAEYWSDGYEDGIEDSSQ